MSRCLGIALTLLLLLLLAGCPRLAGPDAGTDAAGDVMDRDFPDGARDVGDGGIDARARPEVVATSPVDGASNVPTDTALAVAFSVPMREGEGALVLRSDEGLVALDALAWGSSGSTLTTRPSAPLAPGAQMTLTVAGFVDREGTPLAEDVVIRFTTEDRVRPTIVRTDPEEGDLAPAALSIIEIETSEPLRIDRGSATLRGPGSPSLGAPTFTDRVTRFSVRGLAPNAAYELSLSGFVDGAGNPLDTTALGADARLDFTTGPDETAPVVTGSSPTEGQLDVEVALLSRILITFSEPMDTARGTLSLSVDGRLPVPVVPSFDAEGDRLTVDVTGLLDARAPHRLTLDGLVDVAGNPLDGSVLLLDGALDFTTGRDSFAPFVAYLEPNEGDLAVRADTERILVTFSEAMPPELDRVALTGDGRTVILEGTWSAGNTILTLPAPMLQGGRRYDLDFRGFADPGGTPLDLAHPYLGDGIGTFALVAPTGERCGDALTEDQAMGLPGGGYEWTLAPGSASAADGSMPCDVDGHSPDAVIRYRKRAEGTILHVVVVGASASVIDAEIYRDACRPSAPSADAARLRCMPERARWEQWLEVGAGDYFVWVATEAGAVFRGATITVEEVATARVGENCSSPHDEASPLYTPPAFEGDFHTWLFPGGWADAPDRGVMPRDAVGALSCLPTGVALGHDGVIHFEKRSSTSVVTVRATLPAASGTAGGIEVTRGCDPAASGYAPLACWSYGGSALTTEDTFAGPAGPLSVWVVERSTSIAGISFSDLPEARIQIAEIEPGPGDSCATAIPVTPGVVNAITARSPHRAFVPSCLVSGMPSGGVTWFRYTPTERLGVVVSDAPSLAAVVDASTGEVLRCGDDAGDVLPVFAEVGRDVCLALTSSASITELSIDEIPYRGISGRSTVVPMARPAGAPITPTLSPLGWMEAHAGRLYRGGSSVFSGPEIGGTYDWFVPGTMCRHAGVSRPDGLYCLSERTTVTEPRLYRVVDGAGVPLLSPVPIDVPDGTYPSGRRLGAITWDGSRFIAGTAAESVLLTTTTPTSYYAIALDGTVELLGHNDHLFDVAGIAADATFLYVSGRVGMLEGIYRLRRDALSDSAQVPVELEVGIDLFADDGTIAIDSSALAHTLYYRTVNAPRSDVRVIVEPGATPTFRGILWRAPTTGQESALGWDEDGERLLLLDGSTAEPRWIVLE